MIRIARIILLIAIIGLAGYAANRIYKRITYTPPPIVERQEKTITIIEGWTIREIAKYLEEQGFTTAQEFIEFVGKPATTSKAGFRKSQLIFDYPYLNQIPERVSLEGYLFPDTYRVYADASVEDIVGRMLSNFDQKISKKIREDIEKQNSSIYEIITMGSIIEREVRTEEDRPKVSDILWGRKGVGMPLQVDSSVNYVTEKKVAAISNEDKFIDSPYNTYRYKGLPLGPISNPGIASIIAALYPEKTPYVYFLTTHEGEVKYARTLDEHNENKFKYLK